MALPAPDTNAAPFTEPAAEHAAPFPVAARSTWQTARELLAFAVHVDATGFWLAVVTALATSIAEGIGLVLLLPLLSIVGMNLGSTTAAGRLGAFVQLLLVRSGLPHSLWLPAVLGVFLLTAGLRSILRRSESMMNYATTIKVQLTLSHRVYAAVVKAQWGFLVRQSAGRMTHLLTAQLRRVAEAMSIAISIINLCCLTLLYLVIAVKLSAQMTIVVMVIGGTILLLQRSSLQEVRTSSQDLYESIGEVYAATEEHLLNMKSVKTYNAEDRDASLFAALCDEVGRHTVANAKHHAAAAFRFEMGSLVALGGVIFFAIDVLHVQAAAMLLLLAVFTRLMPQLASIQNEAHLLASALPSFDHVLAIEAECLRYAEIPQTNTGQPSAPLQLHTSFSLQHTWFAYQGDDGLRPTLDLAPEAFVLRGVDLEVVAGTLTALVGPSGAGKSTIADLANGLLLPTRGQLLLDTVALGPSDLRRWRGSVGYVGQDTVLFHQSVRQNLLWAQPGASEDEMREALQLAAASFVYELPRGLDSIVGDRGILLSSGQRQRISIARALLRRPSLLILDEATNALDVDNEARVLDSLIAEIHARKTTGAPPLTILMIAHRATAIRRADRVIELDGGQVARTGTPAELGFEAR